MKIDLELLKQQKAELCNTIELYKRNEWREEAIDALTGILHLLDAIQDGIEDEGSVEFTEN